MDGIPFPVNTNSAALAPAFISRMKFSEFDFHNSKPVTFNILRIFRYLNSLNSLISSIAPVPLSIIYSLYFTLYSILCRAQPHREDMLLYIVLIVLFYILVANARLNLELVSHNLQLMFKSSTFKRI